MRGHLAFLNVRHYLSSEKQHPDAVSLGGCSSTHGQTDLEALNLDLSDQLVLSRRTDFYMPGKLPLELSRVIRTNDARPRAYGVGGNHSLNIFPVGNRWPFTWIDLILEDGGRLQVGNCSVTTAAPTFFLMVIALSVRNRPPS